MLIVAFPNFEVVKKYPAATERHGKKQTVPIDYISKG